LGEGIRRKMLAEDKGKRCRRKSIEDGIGGKKMRRIAGAKAVRKFGEGKSKTGGG
jgi:hypothetical protein